MTDKNKTRVKKAIAYLDNMEFTLKLLLTDRKKFVNIDGNFKQMLCTLRNARTLLKNLKGYKLQVKQ